MRRPILAAALAASCVSVALAQEPKPTFEVASVRRNASGAPLFRFSIDFHPNRFVASNVFLRLVIAFAYSEDGRDPVIDRVVGGPSWVDSDPFDIEATIGGAAASPATMKLMLRALLQERFGLRLQKEQRNLPAYALLLDRSDGRLGPQLRPAEAKDCSDLALEEARERKCGGGVYFDQGTQLTVAYGSDADVAALIEHVAGPAVARLERPVVDRTGLSGRFDYELRFSIAAGRVSASPAALPSGPELFTALREQLGLKLEPVTAPVGVLIIDSVQQPTGN